MRYIRFFFECIIWSFLFSCVVVGKFVDKILLFGCKGIKDK